MSTKPYDQAFKFLAEQDPESLLIMLGAIEPDEDATIELLPREISVAAWLPDQPYRVVSPRGERVVHVEAQTYWEHDIPQRFAEYGPLHWFKYRLPVDSYVILLTKKGLPRHPPRLGVIEAGGVLLALSFGTLVENFSAADAGAGARGAAAIRAADGWRMERIGGGRRGSPRGA